MASFDDIYLKLVSYSKDPTILPQPIFDDFFAFNLVPSRVKNRYIELLSQIGVHFFRKTCKSNYQHCLDIRGIECRATRFPQVAHGGISIVEQAVFLDLEQVPKEWTKYLVIYGHLREALRRLQNFDFVKKYTRLSMYHGLEPRLLHPDLVFVTISDFCLNLQKLNQYMDGLKDCQKLQSVAFKTRSRNEMGDFSEWKRALEQFYSSRRQTLKHCQFACHLSFFEIHDNVLCHRTRGDYVKDYDFDSVVSAMERKLESYPEKQTAEKIEN